MNALTNLFGQTPGPPNHADAAAGTFLHPLLQDLPFSELGKFGLFDQNDKLMMAANPGKFQKLKHKLHLIKQLLGKDKIQKDYEHVGHQHHSGGGSKGSDAAISALTLLAFLFFIHVLQTCINEHISAMEADNSQMATVVPVSIRRKMDLSQEAKKLAVTSPASSNTHFAPGGGVPAGVGGEYDYEEYEYVDADYQDVETRLDDRIAHVDKLVTTVSTPVAFVTNARPTKATETYLTPVKIFKSKNYKKTPFVLT